MTKKIYCQLMPQVTCPGCQKDFMWDDYYNVTEGSEKECPLCHMTIEVTSTQALMEVDLQVKEESVSPAETVAAREIGHKDCKWCAPDNSTDPPKWCRHWDGCKHDAVSETPAALPAQILTWADQIERFYGDLPSDRFPGPANELVARMRAAVSQSTRVGNEQK